MKDKQGKAHCHRFCVCASVSMCVHMHVCSCVSTHIEARGQPRVSSQRNSPITLDQPATESQGCVCVGSAFPEVRLQARVSITCILKMWILGRELGSSCMQGKCFTE